MLYLYLGLCFSSSCVNENIISGRSYYNTGSISISDCVFIRQQSFNEHGGVICLTSSGQKMDILFCIFSMCSVDSAPELLGGAIHFKSESSTIKFVCAYKCSSVYVGQFAYIICSQDNYVQYLSLTGCFKASYTIELVSGIQTMEQSNSSLNSNNWGSGLYFTSTSSNKVQYCTIANNQATSSICIEMNGVFGAKLKMNNILENSSPSSYGVFLVYGSSTPRIENCIFYNNKDTLFYLQSGSLTTVECFISHAFTLSFGSIANLNNQYPQLTHSHILKHFLTQNCHANHPVNPKITNNPLKISHLLSIFTLLFIILIE